MMVLMMMMDVVDYLSKHTNRKVFWVMKTMTSSSAAAAASGDDDQRVPLILLISQNVNK